MNTWRWPAEWEPQDGVFFGWPHASTDWASARERVEPVFAAMVAAVSRFERALVVSPEPGAVREALARAGAHLANVILAELPTNDTWTRDFGPIALKGQGERIKLLDFTFNGWGGKFEAGLDNGTTRALAERGYFGEAEVESIPLILEGGSIESNGDGEVLTTAACLLSPGRNEGVSRQHISQALAHHLCARKVHWLEHGHLEGDDTDGHIDTLARFVGPRTIAYVRCTDPSDSHFASFSAMEAELKALRNVNGEPFELIALPWPRAQYGEGGRRLPASYANFLIINGAVLVPTYRDPADHEAVATLGRAFRGREIVPIDCADIVEQSGAVHCLTMQLPAGSLASALPSSGLLSGDAGSNP